MNTPAVLADAAAAKFIARGVTRELRRGRFKSAPVLRVSDSPSS